MEDHNSLIKKTAKRIFSEHQIKQLGKSRLFYYDNAWYSIIIEFQPSSWAKGTYLNVGICWLWHVKEYLSFDVGYRIEDFSEFKDDASFEKVITHYCRKAIDQVHKYLKKFDSPKKVVKHCKRSNDIFWDSYHGFIASLLIGKEKTADDFYKNIMKSDDEREFAINAKKELAELKQIYIAGNIIGEIENRIAAARRLLKLPILEKIDLLKFGAIAHNNA